MRLLVQKSHENWAILSEIHLRTPSLDKAKQWLEEQAQAQGWNKANKLENKIFLKEFQKISTVTWPQFYRSVLKYSLKTSSTSALNILTEMCQFLMNGDKLPDAETIYEMTTSHSSYLSIMAGRYQR